MSKAIFVLPLAFAICCSAALAQSEDWRKFSRDGERAMQGNHVPEALKNYRNALSSLSQSKVDAKDAEVREMLLENIPNLIERLSLDKEFELSEDLAQAKLETTKKTFGENSPLTLDALQDLQSLYSIEKKSLEMRGALMKYAEVAGALRDAGKEAEVTEVEQYRKLRLNRKLKESFERIQRRFVPVNKAMQSTGDKDVKTGTSNKCAEPAVTQSEPKDTSTSR